MNNTSNNTPSHAKDGEPLIWAHYVPSFEANEHLPAIVLSHGATYQWSDISENGKGLFPLSMIHKMIYDEAHRKADASIKGAVAQPAPVILADEEVLRVVDDYPVKASSAPVNPSE